MREIVLTYPTEYGSEEIILKVKKFHSDAGAKLFIGLKMTDYRVCTRALSGR